MSNILIHLSHAFPYNQLLFQRFVKLQHVKVRHENKVVSGCFFESFDDKVIHDDYIIEDVCNCFIKEGQSGIELMHAIKGFHNRQKQVDNVVQFEDPNEANLASPSKNVIIRNFSLSTGVIKLFVCRQFHEIVIERYEQLFANEHLKILGFGLYLIMLEFCGFCENFDFFIENDVTNIVLAYLAYFDQSHHHFQLPQTVAFILQLSNQRFEQTLFMALFAFLLEQFDRFADGVTGEGVGSEVKSFQFFEKWVLLEQCVDQLHPIIFFLQLTNELTNFLALHMRNFTFLCGFLSIFIFNSVQDMQGSRSEARSNWKQSVRKDNPLESRIFGVNRQLPNKFSPSPAKQGNDPSARSLIKQKTNYSHDEYAIAAALSDSRERSTSKQAKLERKPTDKGMMGGDGDTESVDRGRLQSFKSIDGQLKKPIFKFGVKEQDMEIVRELKLQFLRFKERVLKQLRKQEQDLKAAIQQIYDRVGSLQNCTESPIQFGSSPVSLKLNNISLSSPNFESAQSPITKYLEALNKQGPDSIMKDVKSGKKVQAATIIQQSFTPQIKQKMTRFEQLIYSLKHDLNQQFPLETSSSNVQLISIQ